MPIIVTDGGSLLRALSSPINPHLKELLTERVRQLDIEDLSTTARFVIFQPGDTTDDLDQALGFSVFQNSADGTRYGNPDFSPGWEWIEDHGHCYELVFILTDDGFAHVVFVPRDSGVDGSLLNFCATYASEQAVS